MSQTTAQTNGTARHQRQQHGSATSETAIGSRKVYMWRAVNRICACPCGKSCLRRPGLATAASRRRPCASTIPVARTAIPTFTPDLHQGLPAQRLAWILGRGDVEALPGFSSEYRKQREADPSLADLRFPAPHQPRRAKPGRVVTQMHYARRGEITPEMEFIALREGLAPDLRARRSGSGAGHYPGQHQPPRIRADDHRAQFSGENQCQYRQFGGHLVH